MKTVRCSFCATLLIEFLRVYMHAYVLLCCFISMVNIKQLLWAVKICGFYKSLLVSINVKFVFSLRSTACSSSRMTVLYQFHILLHDVVSILIDPPLAMDCIVRVQFGEQNSLRLATETAEQRLVTDRCAFVSTCWTRRWPRRLRRAAHRRTCYACRVAVDRLLAV